MNKSKKIIFGFLIIFILVSGGIGSFYLIGFLTYAVIEESFTFYSKPETSAKPENFILTVFSENTGKINVKYNTSSIPYYIKADVNFKAEGIYMRNSDYEFFGAEWYNHSSGSITELFVYTSPPTLGLFYHPTWTVKYDIAVNVTIRTGILYNLSYQLSQY